MLTPDEISRLTPLLASELGSASLKIAAVKRFHGGASRETYGLDVQADGKSFGLILRRDPADSLIDTERTLEFAAYRSFAGSDVPVPRALLLVEDPAILGGPFFVMERIEGGAAASPFDPSLYGEHRSVIGQQFFTLLGRIHAANFQDLPLAKVVETPSPAACWQRELNHWASVIAKDALEPQPIAEAAIRWLRRQGPPPAPQRMTIVHGDYRTGNVLHDGAGQIIAVLDWEMAHIGDPHEDLAWALDPLWNPLDNNDAAGLIVREEAVRLWQDASGLQLDSAAFRWWEMFATIKGIAIWVSAARAFASGKTIDPVLFFSGTYTLARANNTLIERLAPNGANA